MKARYNDLPDKRTKEVYRRKLEEMQKGYAVLFEKLLLYTLHNSFGYGTKRLTEIFNAIAECVDDMHDDPVFWDKVDRDVIDNLGFDFPRCDYETMEKVFYQPPDVSAEEKRKAVADMCRMRKFLQEQNA